MKKVFAKRITAVLLAAAVLSVCAPSFAADEPEAELHFAAYYDSAGKLIGARAVKGTLSTDEVDTFVDIYEPENTAVAKVFEWTKEMKPINDSGREVDVSDDADVVILHTNDMHGSLAGSSSVIGSDSVAALKKLDDAVLADGGDATQGIALASQSKGEDVIKIMNAAGYDVMRLGTTSSTTVLTNSQSSEVWRNFQSYQPTHMRETSSCARMRKATARMLL